MDEFILESWEISNSTTWTTSEAAVLNGKDGNSTFFQNTSSSTYHYEYIFDRLDIRIIFLTLYTIVFCLCFFGNLMVILVVCLHWRMRSITNFALCQLAIADLCIGIFCVYQHIFYYITENWIFGNFMCKMHHFISSLSTTASILILVVICVERYLAIIHPMRCKQMLTLNRLRITIVGVWVVSALISSPRFYYFRTVEHSFDGQTQIICLPDQTILNTRITDTISLVLLFLLPLTIISVLYFRIGVALWKSSQTKFVTPATMSNTSIESSSSSCQCDESNLALNTVSCRQSSLLKRKRGRKGTIFHSCFNCFNCKLSKGGHKRSGGSFYESDRMGYATVNLTTMNGLGTPNCPSTQVAGRNINGHVTSSSPLPPSIKSSSFDGTNPATILHNHHNETVNIQCCSCTQIASRGTNGGLGCAPASPYLRRDTIPLSTSPAVNTEPIVVVKFQKKTSKCKRGECTILVRSAMSTHYLEDRSKGQNGKLLEGESSFPIDEETSCQICGKTEVERQGNFGTQQRDLIRQKFRPVDCVCDLNEESNAHSHMMPKDLIQAPHHICYGQHCGGSCQTSGRNQCSTFKGMMEHSSASPIATPKGPKRMRVIRGSKYGTRALQCRRRIVKMLIVIVVAFAVCHLPIHARKIWQYWGKGYKPGSTFSDLFTPITFLIMYAQSGINPCLYAFMSKKFRNSFADLLHCNMRRSLKISRNLSVRSTNAVQFSQGP